MPEAIPKPPPAPDEPGMPPIREPGEPLPGSVPPRPEPRPGGEPLPRPGEPIPDIGGGLMDPRYLSPGPGREDMPLPVTQELPPEATGG